MVYLTGDTHRDFRRVAAFCERLKTTSDDVLIILGDAGINYFCAPYDLRDLNLKRELVKLPVTLFCIHGNHEQRPQNIMSYEQAEQYGGSVFIEPEFPSLLFAKDGEIYEFAGKKCLAIGGAYSVDKHIRIKMNYSWWADEQPGEDAKKLTEQRLDSVSWEVDAVLTHTCPFDYLPREMFVDYVKQEDVDYGTEHWLNTIEKKLAYNKWYCGHFHTDKVIDKMRFMHHDFIEL